MAYATYEMCWKIDGIYHCLDKIDPVQVCPPPVPQHPYMYETWPGALIVIAAILCAAVVIGLLINRPEASE